MSHSLAQLTPVFTLEETEAFFKFRNGQYVTHKITGHEAVVSYRTAWRDSGATYNLTSTALFEGKVIEEVFDEVDIQAVEGKADMEIGTLLPFPVDFNTKVASKKFPEITGVVEGLTQYASGCCYIRIERDLLANAKKQTLYDTWAKNQAELILVDSNRVETSPLAPEPTSPEEARAGTAGTAEVTKTNPLEKKPYGLPIGEGGASNSVPN